MTLAAKLIDTAGRKQEVRTREGTSLTRTAIDALRGCLAPARPDPPEPRS